jgi:1,4-alpha-glucan branching enzyme
MMGAWAHDGGVTFRVWTPFAQRVSVAGTFNGWTEAAMEPEGGGYWARVIAEARVGDRYKYVIDNGGPRWKNDPYARQMTNSTGDSVVTGASFDWQSLPTAANLRETIIYEMHIGTFSDTPGCVPGMFRDAIEWLDHISDLGASALEVMPVGEFATDFSMGYNPAFIFAVESAYGGPDGLKKLIDQAHRRNIAVFLDVVYNHLGPSDLDLWQFDGWSENNLGGIYFYNDFRAVTPWGSTRPDYGRPEVRRFLRDNVFMWLEEFRIDGLRWDATAFIRSVTGEDRDPGAALADGWSLMRDINAEVRARMPWQLSIAEDLRGNPFLTRPIEVGGCGFTAQWDGDFARWVRAALVTAEDRDRDLFAVRDAITGRRDASAFERVIYTESHDEVGQGAARLPEAIWPENAGSLASRKRSTLGAVLVMTSPGIPMIFQGQEILEDRWFYDKVPIDWSKKGRYGGIFALYRDLIRLRRNWYDNTRGLRGDHVNVHHVNNEAKVIAFHRWDAGGPCDDVIVLVNLSAEVFENYRIGLPREGFWRVRFSSDWRGYSPDFFDINPPGCFADPVPADGMGCAGSLAIGPYAAIILTQDSD